MDDDLDELDRMIANATPGPWKGCPSPNAADTFSSVWSTKDGKELHEIASAYGATNFEEISNAFFIAAIRNAAPGLIAELRTARKCALLLSIAEGLIIAHEGDRMPKLPAHIMEAIKNALTENTKAKVGP